MIMRNLMLAGLLGALATGAHAEQKTWTFDSLSMIGGSKITVDGHPKLINSSTGKALQFDGDDSVLIENRPLVGASSYTIEAIFRPEGGPMAQRVIHMAETDPATGLDALPTGTSDPNGRWMFEVRVVGDSWYLDAFVNSKAGQKALMNREAVHPLNRWYAITQTYDGKTYRSYVDGQLQMEAETAFTPFGPGRVRAGARMNKLDYFHGSIAKVRFTDRVLPDQQFLKAKN